MKLTIYGAARGVTGSCHCVDACGRRILVDCGLQQGRDEVDNSSLPFAAKDVDFVIVTHAHIDHSGRLPVLVKRGFKGDIFTTRLTAQLLGIMLRDSAHIQESDAMWQNQKGERAGREAVEPLYTLQDVEDTLPLIHTTDYEKTLDICPGIKIRFVDAGHLLGSASVEMWITENGVTKKIAFSGDIGNLNHPVIRDPKHISEADYVVMESTYGDRGHEGEGNYTEGLAEVIDRTLARGGNVIIPSFAVGRTQELLYYIREMKERWLVKSAPNFEVVVDSPLANEATRIYAGDLHGYLDEEALELVQGGHDMFSFPGLRLSQSTDESKLLNADKTPRVIISASGMCDAGRIRHHLKHNLWRPECSVVFVGYQAEGSLGRRLLDGAKEVKLFGETIAVMAQIVNFKGLSSHADKDALAAWAQAFSPAPKQVFVVHGQEEVTVKFAGRLTELGIPAHAPMPGEEYDLAAGALIREGVMPVRKAPEKRDAPAYLRLLAAGKRLMEIIAKNRGAANKDLAKFADQVDGISQKWDM